MLDRWRIALACVVFSATLLLIAHPAAQTDAGRQVLPPRDGFASIGEGVTGGSAADAAHVFVVRTRAELLAALTAGPVAAPRVVYVDGVIDGNVDDRNSPLSCEQYHRDGYTREAFLAFYNPSGSWGPNGPANTPGSLEAARRASAAAQAARIRMRVPDNTTIVGRRRDAKLRGVWLDVRGTPAVPRRNIIIRHLILEDVYDCFPAWTPGRTSEGRWNGTGAWDSEYDAISLWAADRVWIDHNELRDRETVDRTLPVFFGAEYQVHDGLLDITNGSDRVTVSWNRFSDHDKVMLIGNADDVPEDVGKLRVTLHHNLFERVQQRTPRVRYGQVHVYNNYYVIPESDPYVYSWGVGFQPTPVASGIYAENNVFQTEERVTPDRFIRAFSGGRGIFVEGTLQATIEGTRSLAAVPVIRPGAVRPIDPLAAYNALRDPDLLRDVGWQPSVYLQLDVAQRVPAVVTGLAGPFN